MAFPIMFYDKRFKYEDIDTVLTKVILSDNMKVVKELAKHPATKHQNICTSLDWAICLDKLEVINLLVEYDAVGEKYWSGALYTAIAEDQPDKLSRLLNVEPVISRLIECPDLSDSLLVFAIRHHKSITALIVCPFVVPTLKSLQQAIDSEQEKSIKELLACPRLDPTTQDNAALRYAICWSGSEVLRALLADTRISKSLKLDRELEFSAKLRRQALVWNERYNN